MKPLSLLLLPALLAALPLTALAGHDHDDEHGHNGKYKEEYWDGNCKVKREIKKNGKVKEERECRPQTYVSPQPVYVPAPVPAPAPRPGVTIQGTINLP